MAGIDPLSAGLQGAGAIVGGLSSLYSSSQQLAAARQAQNAITGAYNTAQGAQQPYYNAGIQGLGQLQQGNFSTPVPGNYNAGPAPTYTAPTFNYQSSPGYGFQLGQGMKAITDSAAAKGAGLSGATEKSLQSYGTGLANQDYQNMFNQYMQQRQQGFGEYQTGLGQYNTNRQFGYQQGLGQYQMANQQQQQQYGQAANLAGIGQGAAGNLSNLATGYGQSLAGLYGQAGNAQAAGTMGVGQAIGTGLSQFNQSNLANRMLAVMGNMGNNNGMGM
jgi:hypothetical protein